MVSKSDKKYMIITYLMIVVVAILFVCSVYPAEIPDDTASILNDIFHHDRWRDWHPVTYYIFIKVSMWLIKTPHMVVIAQLIMFLLAQYQIVRYIDLYCKKCVYLIYLFFSIFIGFAGYEYLVILQKDSPYSYAFLGMTISVLYCVKEKASTNNLIILGIWCAIAGAMRHMGGLPIIVGVGFLTLILLKKSGKRWPVRIFIVVLAGILFTGVIRQIMIRKYELETPPRYITYTMPLYMLGAYSTAEYELNEKVVAIMEEVMPVEKWQECYNADIFFADNLSRDTEINEGYIENVDDKNLYSDIIWANALYFVQHPIDYSYKLFRMNSLVWSFITPKGSYVGCMTTGGSGYELDKQFPEWSSRKSLSSGLLYSIIDYAKLSSMVAIFYRGGVAFWIIAVTMVWLCIKKEYSRAMILAPITFLNVIMLLSIPMQDPRYVLPEIVVVGICPLLIWEEKTNKKEKNR